ncbi:MAG: UbiD family decarboxylase, partial [Rhodospirillales bacterium]|nr:UbiD family decarboxylase [Rhodospirillales bacterium]
MTEDNRDEIPDLSFREALKRLDKAGLLLKVDDEVDTDLELTSVLFKQPERAMLFKNVAGYDTRVVGNFMGSEENVLAIYEKDVEAVRGFISDGLSNPIPPTHVDEGPVQAVFRNNPDLL